MRHRKDTCKLGRTSSHRETLFANMLQSLVLHERVETTVAKAKELIRHADGLITLAKNQSLACKRKAHAVLRLRYSKLDPKEWRVYREKKESGPLTPRHVVSRLFTVLAPRFAQRAGGYTRIIKTGNRIGDNAPMCIVQYLPE